jgi:hypothetical protein
LVEPVVNLTLDLPALSTGNSAKPERSFVLERSMDVPAGNITLTSVVGKTVRTGPVPGLGLGSTSSSLQELTRDMKIKRASKNLRFFIEILFVKTSSSQSKNVINLLEIFC